MAQRPPLKRSGNDIDLPAGRTCGECSWFIKCARLIGQQRDDERCNWSPRRFRTEVEPDCGIKQLPSGWCLTLHGVLKEFFIGENLFARRGYASTSQKATLIKTWASGNLGDGFKPLQGPLWMALSFIIRPQDGVIPEKPPSQSFAALVSVVLKALRGYLYEDESQVQVLMVHKSWASAEQQEGLRVEVGKA